jgi:diguanylate cyclase (GGDEF)-like protein
MPRHVRFNANNADTSMHHSKFDVLNPRSFLPWTAEIPAELQAAYREHRHQEFLKLVETRSALLVLAFVALLGFTLFFYGEHLHGPDLRMFVVLESLVAILLVGGLYAAHTRLAARTGFSDAMPWMVGSVAAMKVVTVLMMVSKPLAQNEAYMVFLTLLVCVLGMQLSRQQARVAVALGALGFLATPWGHVNAAEWWHLMGQYALTACVCLFIAVLKEDRDRLAFLQAHQLDVEQRRAQFLADQLSSLANQDDLTRLCNRRYFEERLRDEWVRRAYKEQDMSLLKLEVDHFKALNAAHGHTAGDQCLQRLAELLRQVAGQPADLAARYAGNEFVVLLPDTEVVQAFQLATRLQVAMEKARIQHDASPLCDYVTLSIGVASCRPCFKRSPDTLLSMAEHAVDSARRKGRGCVSLSNLGLP